MLKTNNKASKVAEFLLKIKAIKLQPNDPFKWASGWNSPVYCDNRKTLSYPEIRSFIKDCFCEEISAKYGTPDLIAGVATGGIAIGALVAEKMNLPFCYVRAKAKAHGLNNSIEGEIIKGQNVVVIEDLISSGNSSLSAVKDLRAAGLNVVGMAAIFSYGFQIAKENFENANCKLFTLSDYSSLLSEAVKTNFISKDMISSLEEWRSTPSTWNKQ